MRLEDYTPKEFTNFPGLWSRGTDDEVPPDHFTDCLNIQYDTGLFKTRDGLTSAIVLGYGSGKVRRFQNFFHPTAGIITLILDEAGNLYTSSSRVDDNATTPLITVASATNFEAILFFSKIYIAFNDGQVGKAATNLKVYTPGALLVNDKIRDAAGPAPSAAGTITAADGAAGSVNAGVYQIAVIYLTDTGYYTQPGPKIAGVYTATVYTAPGSKKIDLSTIPTGPSYVTSRQILVSKANETELFFLPSAFGGVVAGNVATIDTIDFDDTTDLVSSADYLFDLLETIPAPLGITVFSGKLTTWGENGNQSILRVSRVGDPESFSAIDGVTVVSKDDGFVCQNTVELRSILYVHKSLGVFAVQDNGDIPANWPVYPVDKSINTPIHGISEFFGLAGIRATRDLYFCVDRSGILVFNGTFVKPPLTYKINKIWQTVNWAHYEKIFLVIDEQNHRIFCGFPTGNSTDNDTLIMGDYTDCSVFSPMNIQQEAMLIKWSIYKYKPGGALKNPTTMGIIAITGDKLPSVKFASVDGGAKIWAIDPTATTDDGTGINSYAETSPLFDKSANVHLFAATQERVIGSGNLELTARGEDNVVTANLYTVAGGNPIVLSATPGGELLQRFNFQNEKCKFKWNMPAGGYFTVDKIIYYMKSIWSMRPM